ncbi:hypothetical protein MIZ01_0649 [Sideroxyarcus emersonii]|uniref:Uncharacterized protein n=1 Tax=Sideroxyarcus emersonii TaxID=2764705 RepID=A0AAN1X994_9PROT|nr:hypothetical protein [Sideroxyarcus emersonii]BCK86883.1 hypothetical protein MIZ01_0649 [Sideroxyarcus emersonii]
MKRLIRISTIAMLLILGACSEKVHTKETSDGKPHKGSIFTGNYANLGSQNLRDGELKGTPYVVHLVGQFNTASTRIPTDTATMVWLTRKLEQIPCLYPDYQKDCHKELIVDIATVPPNKLMGTKIVMPEPLQDVPCVWNNSPLLALRTKPIDKATGAVIAAWRFDISNERIIPVQLNEVDCKSNDDEEVSKARAYEFLNNGWFGDMNHGITGLRQIGKVINESVRQIPRKDDPSMKDEIHDIQFDGLTISAYLAHFGDVEKMMVTDVVITSPKWPVKYNLNIGSSRKLVEQTLGTDMKLHNIIGEWSYGDGPEDVSFIFDKEDKVTTIKWHSDLD